MLASFPKRCLVVGVLISAAVALTHAGCADSAHDCTLILTCEPDGAVPVTDGGGHDAGDAAAD